MGVRHEDVRKHDLLAAILAAKEQGIGAHPYVGNSTLRRQGIAIMAEGLQKQQSTQRCAIIVMKLIRDLLDFAGLSSNLAYITSVFIGYIGTDSIGSLYQTFAKSLSRRW